MHRQLVARERAENFVEQVIEAQEIERRRLVAISMTASQRLITLSYRLDAAAQAMATDHAEPRISSMGP
ncbi:hypothetical protein [Mycolicibacterium agri]|uniref:Uncharacterized protein n=1 Tax=Mycolicibacterium agri TaxID=36811 RepID=A0A7I9WBY9_MYCAG|nr:hypothetical protein [Mycolicibacterium agri]GFG55243.1 hypothetical protein MAGR_66840 [Mycolicibacterium agri]